MRTLILASIFCACAVLAGCNTEPTSTSQPPSRAEVTTPAPTAPTKEATATPQPTGQPAEEATRETAELYTEAPQQQQRELEQKVGITLSQEELECLPEGTGQEGTNVMPVNMDALETLVGCLPDASLNRLFLIDGLKQQIELQPETVSCLENSPVAPAMRAAFTETESDEARLGLMMMVMMGATFAMGECLTDVEWARIDQDLGDAEEMRCLLEAAGGAKAYFEAVMGDDEQKLLELEEATDSCTSETLHEGAKSQ